MPIGTGAVAAGGSQAGGPEPAIACAGLTKDFGQGHGVFDLDLEVRRGEIFGFIGPNGAGKTTTLRLLMDLIRPDRGHARLLGLDAHRDSLALKRRIGYLPGELPRFPRARASQVLGLLAGLRGHVDPARVDELAERLDIDLSRRFDALSHGNKQKVGLIQAFMHRPELLLLDEPTLGLDPLMQREFRELTAGAAAAGATVLLSSHVLAEVEALCDRIGLIRDGRLLRVGSMNELRTVRVHQVEAILPAPVDPAEPAMLPGVSDVHVEGDRVRCAVRGSIAPLLAWLADVGAVELDSRELSLEEVFLSEYVCVP